MSEMAQNSSHHPLRHRIVFVAIMLLAAFFAASYFLIATVGRSLGNGVYGGLWVLIILMAFLPSLRRFFRPVAAVVFLAQSAYYFYLMFAGAAVLEKIPKLSAYLGTYFLVYVMLPLMAGIYLAVSRNATRGI